MNIPRLCLTSVLSIITLCGCTSINLYKDKFELQASESAPEDYLMQVVGGDFYLEDGGSLHVPGQSSIALEWGRGISSHVVGADLKSLPKALSITFFSYLENKFYQDHFDLPYNKILSLFQKGYFSPKEGKNITYHSIIAGISPGGGVSVWLGGIDRKTEIFFAKAKEIEGSWDMINDNPDYSRSEFMRLVLEDSLLPETLARHQKNGIPTDLWEKYHKSRYQWQPKFTGIELRDGYVELVKYYNGEEGYLNYPTDELDPKMTRAIPKEYHFIWTYNKKNYSYVIHFDEKEMFEVFEKLGKNNEPLELEMRLFDTDNGKHFGIYVNNKDESINIQHHELKKYTAR